MKQYLHKFLLLTLLLLVPASVLAYEYFSEHFSKPHVYATAAEPLDVASADINNDGYVDVLTGNREGRSISVFMGNGDGSLTPINEVKVGLGVTSLTIADIDFDGNADIAATVCNYGCTKNAIHIYRGNGDGSFVRVQEIDVKGVPYNIFAYDINQDEYLDLVVSDANNARILLLLSEDRQATFSKMELYTGRRPIALAAGDLDGDGFLDFATVDKWDDTVSVFFSDGPAMFSEAVTISVSNLPYALTIRDIDGDQVDDLVVGHSDEAGELHIYLGSKTREFEKLQTVINSDRIIAVYAEDFDNDGLVDVAVALENGDRLELYLNDGFGMVREPSLVIPAGRKITSLHLANMNDDQYPDLLVVDFNTSELSVYPGKAPE